MKPALGANQKIEVAGGCWARAGSQRRRIFDRRVQVFGKGGDDAHAGFAARIGRIDNAEGGLAAGHQSQSGTRVLRPGEPRRQILPHAEATQCLAGVAPERY